MSQAKIINRPKIVLRAAFNADINEPTWRRRGYNVVQGLKELGWNIDWQLNVRDTDADIVILLRSSDRQEVDFLHKQNKVLIFDINDLLVFDDIFVIEDVIRNVDYVVTCSHWMARRFADINPNVICVPDSLEEEFFTSKPAVLPEEPIVFSWHGTNDNLPYFMYIADVLKQIASEYNILVKFITTERNSIGVLNSDIIAQFPFPGLFVEWKRDKFVSDLCNSHAGLIPLHITDFCNCKASHKAISFMALGLPCIASDVPPYRDVIQHGYNGFLAYTDDEWYQCLKQIITSPTLRQTIGENGREMAKFFTIDRIVNLWDRLLTYICSNKF